MPQSMGDLLLAFAARAQENNDSLLSYLLNVAALEAYERAALLNQNWNISPAVGLWDWDVPNNIRHLDPIGASLFGYQRRRHDFFNEDQITRRIHPDDVEGWKKKVHAVAAKGGIYEHEYRVIQNGKIIWLYAKDQCTLNKSGNPERFPGAIMDVTNRKILTLREQVAA